MEIKKTKMRNSDAKHIDFGMLADIIPDKPKILPSDIDMIYERKGKFLVGEWKRAGEDVSHGQNILLDSLAKNGAFHVLLIYYWENHDDIKGFFRYTHDGRLLHAGGTLDELRNFIRRWYDWANKY